MDAPHATVRLLCGTARSGRAAYIDGLMREHWSRAFLLVPTRHYAARRLESIILDGRFDGAWGRCVITFDDFAEGLLKAEGHEPVRVDDATRRLLLERAVADLNGRGALGRFSAVAETGGFASHMLRVITQLKQAAVEPHVFRERMTERAHPSVLDAIVADVYSAYQHALVEANVYDLPGLFWQAALECRDKRPRVLNGIDALILDGFDDFTHSEFRLLQRLHPHLKLLVFGLNYDPNPDRADLFAVTARTAKDITDAFNPARALFEEEQPHTQLEYAAGRIFWRSTPMPPERLETDIEIQPCADYLQEIETIGRRVKSLLLDHGVAPSQIAIIYRNLKPIAGALRNVFSEFGVPLRILQPPSLWESSVCSFILTLLDALTNWDHSAVVDVLTSPWFPGDGPHKNEIPLLTRTAQIMAGRRQWDERLNQLAARIESAQSDDIAALLRRMPHAPSAIAALRVRLNALDKIGEQIPARGCEAELAAGLLHALDDLELDKTAATHPLALLAESEANALAALRRLLVQWQAWNHDQSQIVSRSRFALALRQSFQETAYTYPQPKAGVVCMDAVAARHLQFGYVFLAGANEGELPAPASGNAIYAETDIRSLRQAGIPLDGRQARTEREMLLFHHVLCMPRKRLCITWHRLGGRGKECYPSPYVNDLLALFPGTCIQAPMPSATAFVPSPHEIASWRDLRNFIHMQSTSTVGQSLERDARSRIGAEIEQIRHSDQPFCHYDGVLSAPDAVAAIAREFGLDHLFSVNQLERYAACPFGFLVDRILDLDEADAPSEDFDPRLRGTIMHDALQAFHEHYRGQSLAEIPLAEARATLRQALEESFARLCHINKNTPHGVTGVEMERLAIALDRYLMFERNRGADGWLPSHFEVEFGAEGRSQDELSCKEPFCLETDNGPVRLSGRIDRIDRREEEARIIDFKSTISAKRKDILEGRSLQLAVYAMALESLLLKDVHCAEAKFVHVGKDKEIEALGRTGKTDQWDERRQVVREKIAAIVAAIQSAQFPPTPADEACRYCGARQACRYEKGRIERKDTAR